MKKSIGSSKKLFVLLILFIAIFLKTENVFAATEVSTFGELKQAVETGGEIVLKKDITVTETLTVNNDVKISGGGC